MAGLHQNSPSSLWERIVLWATAIAEAAEMDTFGYLVGRIDHLERRIATARKQRPRRGIAKSATRLSPGDASHPVTGAARRTGDSCRYQNR
jgi:hypothetical protein